MRGLSADQLARRVGASRSKIYKLENGTQRLTDVWIARLAEALGAAPADFLSASGSSIPVSHYISAAFSGLASFHMPEPVEQISPPRRLNRPQDCLACEIYDDSCDGIYPQGSLVIVRRLTALQAPLTLGDRIVARHYVDNVGDGRVMEIILGHLDRTITGDLVLLTRSANPQVPGIVSIRRPVNPASSLGDAQNRFRPMDAAALPDYQPEPDDQADILGVVAMVIQPENAA